MKKLIYKRYLIDQLRKCREYSIKDRNAQAVNVLCAALIACGMREVVEEYTAMLMCDLIEVLNPTKPEEK